MLTGQLPVGDFDPAPPPFQSIVRKALAQDPARRYATADEMRKDLEAVTSRPHGLPVELAADEKNWVRGVALLQSIATAVALWAFTECLTPKTFAPGEIRSLVMHVTEELKDGRVFSPARFETWSVLAALATLAVALFAYGLLRRHWKRAGLEVSEPDRPVRGVRWVVSMGVAAVLVYAFHKWLESRGHVWASTYSPIVGGAIEVAALYFLWMSILEAWRTARPLLRERLLWFGFGLALVPPVIEFARYVIQGRP